MSCHRSLVRRAQLGADYNAHVLESILNYVVSELSWR
jgi:hypothetical protein